MTNRISCNVYAACPAWYCHAPGGNFDTEAEARRFAERQSGYFNVPYDLWLYRPKGRGRLLARIGPTR